MLHPRYGQNSSQCNPEDLSAPHLALHTDGEPSSVSGHTSNCNRSQPCGCWERTSHSCLSYSPAPLCPRCHHHMPRFQVRNKMPVPQFLQPPLHLPTDLHLPPFLPRRLQHPERDQAQPLCWGQGGVVCYLHVTFTVLQWGSHVQAGSTEDKARDSSHGDKWSWEGRGCWRDEVRLPQGCKLHRLGDQSSSQ